MRRVTGDKGSALGIDPGIYRGLADAVLVLHVGVVGFIVAGLVLIMVGGVLRWQWVRNFWFRAAHLAAIGYVALQAWFDIACPLTTLEQWLRTRAGQAGYAGDFVAYWLERWLFYQAPQWVFIAAYSLFGLLVLSSWLVVRPSPPFGRARRAGRLTIFDRNT